MAFVTLTSTNSNLTERLSIERCNNNKLRDASFSSHLNSTEESYVQVLTKSSGIADPLTTKGEDRDGEIGVFGAEKYFNGVINHEEDSKAAPRIANSRNYLQCKKDDDDVLDLDSAMMRPGMQQPGTPSVRSESSRNSQSMLLNSIRIRDASKIKSKKVNGRSFLGGLGCKCYCSDKDSVDIHEQVREVSFRSKTASSLGLVQGKGSNSTKATIKSSPGPKDVLQVNKSHSDSLARDKNVLSFPALKSYDTGNQFQMKIQFEKDIYQDIIPRKSLEVFGSPVDEKRSKSLVLDHPIRPTMLSSWDTSPKSKAEFENSGGVYTDDCESDASSDLFEIDSLTGKRDPYLKKQVSDVTLSDCATPCYAPSEASIEWSVVTASAADFSTVSASDYEDQAYMPISCSTGNKTFLSVPYARTKENKDGQKKGGPSALLGCKNYKAVKVAGDHDYSKKSFDSRMRRRSDSTMLVPKFQAEHFNKHFDTKHEQRSSMSPSHHLPMSRSTHASIPLYTAQ